MKKRKLTRAGLAALIAAVVIHLVMKQVASYQCTQEALAEDDYIEPDFPKAMCAVGAERAGWFPRWTEDGWR